MVPFARYDAAVEATTVHDGLDDLRDNIDRSSKPIVQSWKTNVLNNPLYHIKYYKVSHPIHSQFKSDFVQSQLFSCQWQFWDKCAEWPQNDFEH